MIEEQYEEESVIVDMFCGGGGESKGLTQAADEAGANIKLYAINHWQQAIETHRANFPGAEHVCRDIREIDPSDIVPGGHVALLHSSPECTHHSVARGGKPCNNQSRITPFTILDWLNKLTVDRLIIENVPEFRFWGPLDPVTQRPIKEAKGEIFDAFIGMIQALGYTVDYRDLVAADFGAPTTRKRLFIQAVRNRSGKSIIWPEPTHFKPGNHTLPLWISAREIIDWSIPTQVVDDRKRPLVANTMRRILHGIEKYWGPYAKPFLARYNGTGKTTGGNGFVQPFVLHIGQTSGKNRTRSIDDPLATVVTKQEACLIEPLFIPQHSCGEVRPTTNPLSTIATKGAIGIVEPLIMPYRLQSKVRPAGESPIPTLVTAGWIGLIEPLIMNYYGTGICHPVTHPLPSVTTRDRFALITPENVRIGFRMLKPKELAAAQGFPRDYIFTGNQGEIVKQIGNAVCPPMAKALALPYMQELATV